MQNTVQDVIMACTSFNRHTIIYVQNNYEVAPHLSSHEGLSENIGFGLICWTECLPVSLTSVIWGL